MALPNSGKRDLILAGSEHNTFTDLPRIIDAIALSGSLPPEATDMPGTTDGAQALGNITTIIVVIFDLVMRGKEVHC
jgi:hypothetical protein